MGSKKSEDDDNNFQCPHPQFISNNCAKCNKPINDCGNLPTKPFSYIFPDLSLTDFEINRLRDVNLEEILSRKKLNLLLDLDNTLVHAKTLISPLSESDRETIQLMNLGGNVDFGDDVSDVLDGKYLVKLRPGARVFIELASTMFDLSIYTKGTRPYAFDVAELLDSSMFVNVISKEDCTDPKLKGLDVVLAHERVVLIVDDNQRVWSNHRDNLIKIKPYFFFPSNNDVETSDLINGWCKISSESEGGVMDDELVRVLNKLRLVHSLFYDEIEKGNLNNRDVRRILKRVQGIESIFGDNGVVKSSLGKRNLGKSVIHGPCNMKRRRLEIMMAAWQKPRYGESTINAFM